MRALIPFLALASLCSAANLSVGKVTAPVFNASGRLVCRIRAESVTGPAEAPRLGKGVVEFYSVDSTEKAMAVLEFDQAVWNQSAGTISDDGSFRISSSGLVAMGRGYCYRLDTMVCEVASDVLIESDSARLVGSHATLAFSPERHRETVLKEAVVYGSVVVTAQDGKRLSFERVETERVRYDPTLSKVFVTTPARVWRKGYMMETNPEAGFIEIDLSKSAEPGATDNPDSAGFQAEKSSSN